MELFQQLGASGITIVVVTHEADIGHCAERAIVMRDGRILTDTMQAPMPAHQVLAGPEAA